jgi:hypothetical protein
MHKAGKPTHIRAWASQCLRNKTKERKGELRIKSKKETPPLLGLPQLDFITGVNHFRPPIPDRRRNPLARIPDITFLHVGIPMPSMMKQWNQSHLGSGDRYLNFFQVEFTPSQPKFMNPQDWPHCYEWSNKNGKEGTRSREHQRRKRFYTQVHNKS